MSDHLFNPIVDMIPDLSLDRDFYAEGYDACMKGASTDPPTDLDPLQASEWVSGYSECLLDHSTESARAANNS